MIDEFEIQDRLFFLPRKFDLPVLETSLKKQSNYCSLISHESRAKCPNNFRIYAMEVFLLELKLKR